MRLLVAIILLLSLTLSCTREPTELSDTCKQIIESDSFYYALPIPEAQFDARWTLNNFLTTSNDSGIQTIDFDCVVAVHPTNEKLLELQQIAKDNFDEISHISTKHAEATRCVTESRGIRFIEPTGQLIRFKSTNQTWVLDMEKDKFWDWKFILFRKGKHPEVIPNIRMTFEKIDEYFESESEGIYR